MILNHISEAIGNTPLLKIDQAVHGIKNLQLYCKLEYMNPFGSLKDRPAGYFIHDMINLPEKNKAIEASSGNTIKALGSLANTYGYRSKTVTNRIKIQEQLDMLKILGVEVQQVPAKSQCVNFSEYNNPVTLIENQCKQDPHRYHSDQYRNKRNTQSHMDTTAQEIHEDLGSIEYFFSGLGTTGSSGGITKSLRTIHPSLISIGIVSESHDFIPGIRNHEEMSEVGIFDKSLYNDTKEVTAIDSVDKTIELIRRTGMLCGPTTGAVYQGLLDYFSDITLDTPTTAVFLGCDRIENYFSYIKQRVPDIFHQHHKECILSITQHDEQQFYTSISAEQLQNNLDEYLLIDTRSTKSFQLGYIQGSINIPLQTLNELVDKGKTFSSNRPIVLLCMQGKKTRRLCAFLNKLGYTAYNLEGGLHQRKSLGMQFKKFGIA